ncbi:hypothetical protein ACP70R_019467 [Stipagrostis hirtigluma subsp. patula]
MSGNFRRQADDCIHGRRGVRTAAAANERERRQPACATRSITLESGHSSGHHNSVGVGGAVDDFDKTDPKSEKAVVDLDKLQVSYWIFIGLPFSSPLSYLRDISVGYAILSCEHSSILSSPSRHSILSMDAAVLSAFLQVLFQVFVDFVKKELQSEHGLQNEQKCLISNVEMIQAVLRGAEKLQLSELQKLWFSELKDVSYDALEVLDEYFYEVQRHQVIYLASMRNSAVISLFSPRRQIFRHAMEKKITDIAKRIASIKETRLAFQVDVHGAIGQHDESRILSQSSSFPPSVVYGRHSDTENIVNMLLRSDLKANVAVLPILGEAYVGKTTVTQLVVNDERVSMYFELKLWVHVSHEFNIKRITASIIESIEGSPFHSDNLNTLQMRLEKLLRGARYLLVLDDYWNESWHNWDKLKLPLLKDAGGSKIIVTTRSAVVARVIGTSAPYQLQHLQDEDCWLLFCHHALGTQIHAHNFRDFLNRRLKEEVLRKCKGVPFIAICLGHRVHQENDLSNWTAILLEENWDSTSHLIGAL